ncbi:MAG: hypothetical protein HRJ53_14240 [Acidobacteria bacterium Pan2503]|uniref:N-acetyltransferase domain-containing protein n=1 Tax=Candidatus Acidiferrum panamense TaxID=2741543 RepID=A0A7V8SXL8_9BACT|nr:hypothetical protein [Candidatus Acidoferrum panamensis]
MSLRIIPITHLQANEFVRTHHRHHRPTVGCILCIGLADDDEELIGVAIMGRPVSRVLDDGTTIEITRLCTDGSKNACSKLYGTCRRIAKELGYQRCLTYTLPSEGGASLRAAGFHFNGEAGGGQWNCPSRPRQLMDDDLIGGKWRWVA